MRTLDMALGAIMLVAIVLSFAATRDFSRPNLEVMPDMVHGPTYQAFEANPNTDDGKTLREPPAGSIPRGLLPLSYERTEQDALRAAVELTNPYPADDLDVLDRGATAYAAFCQPCHGPSGAADGVMAKRKLDYPPPPSLLLPHAIDMKDGQMLHVITYGQNNMPSHAAQVSREDRWKIISHLRTLQASAPKQPTGAQEE